VQDAVGAAATLVNENINLAKQDGQVDRLPCADGAAFNSQLWEQEPRCLANTRVELLRMIGDWSRNTNSTCIFWLRGMAGTGKSTIARTVADNLAKDNLLGASFFFSRGRGDLGKAGKLVTTIAAQLAGKDRFLRHYIGKAIADNSNIIQQGLGEQWKHLMFQPLIQLEERVTQPQMLAIVIDALDECEDEDKVRLLLQLLPQLKCLQKVRVRTFITSRPEPAIRHGFDQMSKNAINAYQGFALGDINQVITEQDIHMFLLQKLKEIGEDHKLEVWPCDKDVRRLTHRASGLFIHAATVCRFIREEKYTHPQDSLALLLKGPTTFSPESTLYEMYTQVLKHSIFGNADSEKRERLSAKFREVAGPIVILSDTLSFASYSKLIDPEGTKSVRAVLGDLHSVLDISDDPDRHIQLLHPSFRDFLLDTNRHSSSFQIDERKTHENVAYCSLRVMSNHLKKDVCSLKAPGALASTATNDQIEQYIPSELRYACRYWVEHVQKSKLELHDDDQIHVFLCQHLLHWLEALSWMGKTSEGVLAINALESCIQVSRLNSRL
jgi:hypothetical protein